MSNRNLINDTNKLMDEIIALREEVYEEGGKTFNRWLPEIERNVFLPSAENLAAYLAIRRRDMRDIQDALALKGLSSLGRSESRVLSNIDAILMALSKINEREIHDEDNSYKQTFVLGRHLLERNSKRIFGEAPMDRYSRIMVTLPTEAADDEKIIPNMMKRGMNVARINCAHDNQETWSKMIENIKKSEAETGLSCKIVMDIAGPKVRINKLLTTAKNPKVGEGDAFLLTNRSVLDNYHDMDIVCSCSEPEIISDLQVDDPVSVDDGMISAHVEEVKEHGVIVRIDRVLKKSVRLKVEKGINFPQSNFKIDILTEVDKENLDFACEYADIIGFSFIKDVEDLRICQQEIINRVGKEKAKTIPVMVKVETIAAIENLPEIIVAGAGKNPFSVMIARGDLAVEAGFLRLAELQEEILWICEAAHVPVVWATQVLESMVKSGIPSRAEITDAAMGGRAECVMLNKGGYILDGVESLDNILQRMVGHQHKKTPRLRPLRIAEDVGEK